MSMNRVYTRASDSDTCLDFMQVGPNGTVDLKELGSQSQEWLKEYELLRSQYPGFVGFIVKRVNGEGRQILERHAYVPYKQFVEQYVKMGQVVLHDVWRDYLANDTDQDYVALGGQYYDERGGVHANRNMALSGLPRHLLAKRRGGK
jgi:hypothetical protein